jgi:hypothetical protein
MKINCVFQCIGKEDHSGEGSTSVNLTFMPPYCVDKRPGTPYDPATHDSRYQRVNEGWSKATPSGTLTMTVTTPEAAAAFVLNEYYALEFDAFAR